MCGRYQAPIEDDELEYIIDMAQAGMFDAYMSMGEIMPTMKTPVIIADKDGKNTYAAARITGGYRMKNSPNPIINARSETLTEKPMFSRGFERGRCIIPASGFYEWTSQYPKKKYLFTREDEKNLYLAGVYDSYMGESRYVIITTQMHPSARDIHDRMPVIIGRDEAESWLYDRSEALHILSRPGGELMRRVI